MILKYIQQSISSLYCRNVWEVQKFKLHDWKRSKGLGVSESGLQNAKWFEPLKYAYTVLVVILLLLANNIFLKMMNVQCTSVI